MAKKQRKATRGAEKKNKTKNVSHKEPEENGDASSTASSDIEEQNYGRAADEFDDSNEKMKDESDDSSDEEEEEDLAAALFSGGKRQNDDNHDDEGSSEDEEDDEAAAQANQTAADIAANASTSGPFTFDLRNLLAISTDQLATSTLYSNKSKPANTNGRDEEDISIPLDLSRKSIRVNEDFLLKQATTGCTQLIRALWQLPTEQGDAGPLVTLPTYDEVRLPRALVCFVK
jgi:hypothetical protein